jgi:DNA-binding IclR family transcriptional regulator
VLAVVRERPGVTARELAAASGVTGGTLYSLLARLTARGELAKRDLPGGQTGYALADSDAPATVAAGADTINENNSPTHTRDTATAEDQPAADRPEPDEV